MTTPEDDEEGWVPGEDVELSLRQRLLLAGVGGDCAHHSAEVEQEGGDVRQQEARAVRDVCSGSGV